MGASIGGTIGSVIPGLGTAVGAGVGAGVGAIAGGISGNIKGKKEKKAADAQAIKDKAEIEKVNAENKENARLAIGKAADQERYSNILRNVGTAKKGGKLIKRSKDVPCAKNGGVLIPRFRRGGTLDLEKENVILDGPSHDDNNKTGVKGDKGLPVVKGGVKVAEIESLELILNKTASKELENLVKEFKKTGDKRLLKEIGTLMKSEINHNTYDYSKELL